MRFFFIFLLLFTYSLPCFSGKGKQNTSPSDPKRLPLRRPPSPRPMTSGAGSSLDRDIIRKESEPKSSSSTSLPPFSELVDLTTLCGLNLDKVRERAERVRRHQETHGTVDGEVSTFIWNLSIHVERDPEIYQLPLRTQGIITELYDEQRHLKDQLYSSRECTRKRSSSTTDKVTHALRLGQEGHHPNNSHPIKGRIDAIDRQLQDLLDGCDLPSERHASAIRYVPAIYKSRIRIITILSEFGLQQSHLDALPPHKSW